jgi:hypothetical protein
MAMIGSIGMAQAAERIRYKEIPGKLAPFGTYVEWRRITVTTVDGAKHSGRQLLLQPDHLRVLRNDDDWEDLPSHDVARIEVRQRGRFLPYVEGAFWLPLMFPAAECENTHHPVICWTISSVAFSPAWVTVAAIPFFLAADGIAFFIPPKVYEIIH